MYNTETATDGIHPTLLILMAVATGLSVAGNYYIQPLLDTISITFDIGKGQAGLLVTVAQSTYAVGLLFLIPIADVMERRSLIVGMTLLSSLGLLLIAVSDSLVLIYAGIALTGLFSVVTQLFMPLAVSLAPEHQRGKVVGSIMTGLLLGILLARTISGALAMLGGWQTVYRVAFVAMLIISGLLWKHLPKYRFPTRIRYGRLLLSVLSLFRDERVFRNRSVIGCLSFANFSVLWTAATFLLAGPAYGYSDGTIGLFGLVGAVGALATRPVGKAIDRGSNRQVTGWGLLLLFLSWFPMALGEHSLAALLIGIVGLDLAVQGVQVANQSAIFRHLPEARNRMTSGYMTSYFIGGALGSLLSAYAYSCAAWTGVVLVGMILSGVDLIFYAVNRTYME